MTEFYSRVFESTNGIPLMAQLVERAAIADCLIAHQFVGLVKFSHHNFEGDNGCIGCACPVRTILVLFPNSFGKKSESLACGTWAK